jgi:hypothetical protein
MATMPPPNGMEQLAQRYADELSAQFRTLNLFVQHAGEIGRAHETFLRSVLERFLPSKVRCGTGFVASKDGVTTQQDIIIFDESELPTLFKAGECFVVDRDALVGTVEVKTVLDSEARFNEAVQKLAAQRKAQSGRGFTGLYAWDGLTEAKALECIWGYYRSLGVLGISNLPDAIYIRGKFLILRNDDTSPEAGPIKVMSLGSEKEGAALLSFVNRMILCSYARTVLRPWWMRDWDRRESEIFYVPERPEAEGEVSLVVGGADGS